MSFLKEHDLINGHQLDVTPGDSTIHQVIVLYHKLYIATDGSDDILCVFLDLTKTFDQLWHRSLLFKLNKINIIGEIYNLLESYIFYRKQ